MVAARKFWSDVRMQAVSKFESGERSITALVECGSGKSSLPSAVAYDLFMRDAIDAVVWSVPRLNLATQAAESMSAMVERVDSDGRIRSVPNFTWQLLGVSPSDAKKFEILALTDGGNPSSGTDPSKGSFGYSVSYSSLASGLFIHEAFARKRRILLIGDEIQMARRGSAWGNAYEAMQRHARFSLQMSGDFDRDGGYVAGVQYSPRVVGDAESDREDVLVDVHYSIYDALNERVILPIDFAFGSGSVKFTRGDVTTEIPSIASASRKDASSAVWAALHSQYARQLLSDCTASWRAHRKDGKLPRRAVDRMPDAQMMVVCATKDQARKMRDYMLESLGFTTRDVAIAVDDEPGAAETLKLFCRGQIPVIVTVAMAYIGTDAPGLSHLCCLTHYRTPSWLHQMLARAWRVRAGKTYCVCYGPDDPPMLVAIDTIRAAQQIGISSSENDPEEGGQGGDGAGERQILIAEHSALTSLRNNYEIESASSAAVNGSPPVVTEARTPAPDVEATRASLLALGHSEEAIDRMIAAAAEPPPAESLTDRIAGLSSELEEYQRTTCRMVAGVLGHLPDWRSANTELVRRMGKTKDQMTESELRAAVSVHAPKVRENLLRNARRVCGAA